MGVNYYATLYGYDGAGNQDETISPERTIYLTVYDGQHRVVSKWVGTYDYGLSDNNLVEVESFQYDNGGVGDGNLTETVQYPGGSAADRVTNDYYNWRDQKVAEKDGVSSDESAGVNRPLTVWTYDNLGEVIETQVYNWKGITPTISSGELSLPSGAGSAAWTGVGLLPASWSTRRPEHRAGPHTWPKLRAGPSVAGSRGTRVWQRHP